MSVVDDTDARGRAAMCGVHNRRLMLLVYAQKGKPIACVQENQQPRAGLFSTGLPPCLARIGVSIKLFSDLGRVDV
jgi:hypothetical protein